MPPQAVLPPQGQEPRQADVHAAPTRPARVIMVQGTASSVGKSTLTAALCRIFQQDGLSVAPFKSQNMSNNSYVTPGGGEIGRAQALQAVAAGVEASTDMNPVLLKPEADSRAHVVVNGRARGSFAARDYYRTKGALWPEVTAALDRLRARHDVVVIEGAGSPAEVNLRHGDIANMSVALYAQAPVLLVGDIDRGGVFAALLGTLELLAPEERALVRGLVINRFRGDRALLEPLPAMIAARTGVPVLGVVPFVPDLRLSDEDAASLDGRPKVAVAPVRPPPFGPAQGSLGPAFDPHPRPPAAGTRLPERERAAGRLRAAVVRLPHISNFDDFDPLRRAAVEVNFISDASGADGAHIVIIPGTKSTIADLRWMKARHLARAVTDAADRGAAVIGICGGYQMLCESLSDPLGADSGSPDAEPGIGLLPGVTVFAREKTTLRVEFTLAEGDGLLAGNGPATGRGYEIHTGATSPARRPAALVRDVRAPAARSDGALSESGWVMGTYLHGLFDSPAVLTRLLGNVARRHGLPEPQAPDFSLDRELDRLADVVRASLDMPAVYGLLGLSSPSGLAASGQARAVAKARA